jgi:hypothetical protein
VPLRHIAEHHDPGDSARQRILVLAPRRPIVLMQHDPAGPDQPSNGCARIEGGLIACLQRPAAPVEERHAGFGTVFGNAAIDPSGTARLRMRASITVDQSTAPSTSENGQTVTGSTLPVVKTRLSSIAVSTRRAVRPSRAAR